MTASTAEEITLSGRVVFPVVGKKPLVRWGQLDQLSITDRRTLVRSWWRRWPDASIGMQTGAGLVVIDIDPHHGGVVDPAWPETREARTPHGGRHRYYTSSKPIPNSVGRVAPGVDVRGERGYVLVPPSPGYVWVNADAPIVELPPLVLASSSPAARGGAGGYGPPFEFRDHVPHGERHAYLVSAAGYMYSAGYTPLEVEDFLVEHAREVCAQVPAYDDADVRKIVISIARYHQ